jgi:hypothetical protein
LPQRPPSVWRERRSFWLNSGGSTERKTSAGSWPCNRVCQDERTVPTPCHLHRHTHMDHEQEPPEIR